MTLKIAVNIVDNNVDIEQSHKQLCDYLGTEDFIVDFFVCNDTTTDSTIENNKFRIFNSSKLKKEKIISKLSNGRNKELLKRADKLIRWSYKSNINAIKMIEQSYIKHRYDMVISPGQLLHRYKLNPYNLKSTELGFIYTKFAHDGHLIWSAEFTTMLSSLTDFYKMSHYWKLLTYEDDETYSIFWWWNDNVDYANYIFVKWCNMQSIKLRDIHGY